MHNLDYVIVARLQSKFSKHTVLYTGYNVCRNVNYTKDKASYANY